MAEQVINVPGVGPVAFPDTMSDVEITGVVKRLHLQSQVPDPKTLEQDTLWDKAAKFGSSALRALNPLSVLPRPSEAIANLKKVGEGDWGYKQLSDPNRVTPSLSDPSVAGDIVGKMALGLVMPRIVSRVTSPNALRTAASLAGDVSLVEPLKLAKRGLNAVADWRESQPGGSPNALGGTTAPRPATTLPEDMGSPNAVSGTTPPRPAVTAPTDAGSPNATLRITPPALSSEAPPALPEVSQMAPRIAGKAPTLESTLDAILKEYQQSGEPAQSSTLGELPGSDSTPAVVKHAPAGKKVKVGSTTDNPPKTAAQAAEVHEPRSVGKDYLHTSEAPASKPVAPASEPAATEPQADYMKQLEESLRLQQSEQTPTPSKVPLSDIAASKSKRGPQMSPISGMSLSDYDALAQISPGLKPEWIKAIRPDLVEQFLELRKNRGATYRINAGMDAAARRAAEREP